jgi:hypothetical protein
VDTQRLHRLGISRRFWAGSLAAVLVVASLATATVVHAFLDLKRGPDEYNIADWELRHVPEKWLFLLDQALDGAPSREDQDQTLRRFFALTEEIEQLEGRLSANGRNNTPAREGDVARLATLIEQRDALENQVEATIEARLTKVAADAGLTRSFLSVVWPPIDTEFTRSPYSLVTSRRTRIELLDASLLRTDLSLAEVEAIEASTEAAGDVSALAFPVGGIGAYPTIVDYPTDYRGALEVVAHEWMHNYLFFYPLGFNYYDNNELRAINETVADLVGKELAEAVLARWPLEADAPTPPPASSAGERRFDLGAALRSLRSEVEAMLGRGEVEAAEALMEQRRLEFAAEGYHFRKLNQAYFAFTNLYAGQAGDPSAVNPIGPKVDELRRRSDSLDDFVRRVRGVTSAEELDSMLDAARGISP